MNEALDYLATLGADFKGKPVVRLLVGDSNLDKEGAARATQGSTPPEAASELQSQQQLLRWEVHTTEAGKGGDVVFCSGAFFTPVVVPVGVSFEDRGMRNDSHDVVAGVLQVPLSGCGAHQPATPRAEMSAAASVASASPSVLPATTCAHAAGIVQVPLSGGGALQPAAPSGGDALQPAAPPGGDALQPAAPRAEMSAAAFVASASPSVLPATASAHVDLSPTSPAFGDAETPDWGGDEHAAEHLHSELLRAQENEQTDEDITREIGRILFMKRVTHCDREGIKRTIVATLEETREVIASLLSRRRKFLHSIGQENTQHILTNQERASIMGSWKQEYHASHEQVELQCRDSWKEKSNCKGTGAKCKRLAGWGRKEKGTAVLSSAGKGKVRGPGFGPNNAAVIRGKHSRFSRHLQRVGGSKVLVELILFTGRVDASELRDVLDRQLQHSSEAPQLAGGDRAELKKAVMLARFNLRIGRYFSGRIAAGGTLWADLSTKDAALVEDFRSGRLQQVKNEAVVAFGHGNLVDADGNVLAIGGSTGGTMRRYLDNFQPPSLETTETYLRSRGINTA